MRTMFLLALLALGTTLPALAQGLPAEGPRLSVASNLSQGGQARLLAKLRLLGVRNLRDGMNWALIEKVPGRYDFSSPRVAYPDGLIALGIGVSATVNWGNPLYEEGATPVTAAGLQALADYTRALLERFPSLESLEVGNEFNGTNFVKGPMQSMTPTERAKAYIPFLAAAAQGARDARPDIRILGGSTHSMAAGYIWEVLDAGGGRYLDALAIHPYTTPAEQLVRQVAVLRRHPQAAPLPLEMTEFGSPDPAAAASHMVRNYCQMALSGVSRAAWYPLNDRGDGMVPLLTASGDITGAGRAYSLIAEFMEGRPVLDPTADDAATYGCQFGRNVVVLWGAERAMGVSEGLRVINAEGLDAPRPLSVTPYAPLIVVDDGGGDVMAKITLESHRILADSFHDFAYPKAEEVRAPGDRFERFARRGEQVIPLVTRPGQERPGTPWFPYRAGKDVQQARLTAETLTPAGNNRSPVEIVHRYSATDAGTVVLKANFATGENSETGITVSLRVNGAVVDRHEAVRQVQIDRALALERGDTVELSVDPNGSPKGDTTKYRITISAS